MTVTDLRQAVFGLTGVSNMQLLDIPFFGGHSTRTMMFNRVRLFSLTGGKHLQSMPALGQTLGAPHLARQTLQQGENRAALECSTHLFFTDRPLRLHQRDRFLQEVDSTIEGGLPNLAAASTPVDSPMRKDLKPMSNWIYHQAVQDLLLVPLRDFGWV